MSDSLLLNTSIIFDNSNLIDRIRQTCIDLHTGTIEEDVQAFLAEARTYMQKDLPDNVANELFQAIFSSYLQFTTQLYPTFEELLTRSRLNSNYVIITALILSYLTHVEPPLTLPDYHSFVDDALSEILPQIQNKSDKNLTVFGHTISPSFKIDLVINLLLSSTNKSKLISKFFPFISSRDLVQTNPNLISLFHDISKSDMIQILPQTDQSKEELYQFITKEDIGLIPTMSETALSFIEYASIYTVTKRKSMIEGFQKELVLQFIAVLFIFIKKNKLEISFAGATDANLFLEGAKCLSNDDSKLAKASVDFLISNYTYFDKYRFFSFNEMLQMISIFVQQLPKGEYKGTDMILLFATFDLSHNQYYTFDVKYFFEKNGNELFIYIFKHLREINNYESYKDLLHFENQSLDLDKIDSVHVTFQVIKLLKEDFIQALYYIDNFCTNKLDSQCLDKISHLLIPVIQDKIKKEKWDEFLFIVRFMQKNDLNDAIQKLHELDIPENIHESIFGFVPNDDISIDELLDHILMIFHPEKDTILFEKLFDKMMNNDKEILQSYLGYTIAKYSFDSCSVSDFLSLFLDEFKKYKDDFMKAVNDQYYFSKDDNLLIRKPHFQLSSYPISESGVSIVNRLFNEIEKKSTNFQAFICLKNIANCFPFLFLTNPQKVFDTVIPFLDNIALFNEKHLNDQQIQTLKTSFSAMSFLLSTLHATKILDDFIKWVFTNISTFSNEQIFCLILILLSTFHVHLVMKNISVWVMKYNVFDIIGNLLDKINQSDTFSLDFKECIYMFLKESFVKFLNYTKEDTIQKDEFVKIDQPLNYAFDTCFSTFPWNFKPINSFLYHKHFQLDCFMNDVQHKKKCWLSYNFKKYRTKKAHSHDIENFISKMEKDWHLIPTYKLPSIPKPLTVKMVRYLVMESAMIYLNILFSQNIPLVQETFDLISKSIEKLNEMAKDKNDVSIDSYNSREFLSKLYNQPSLFKSLIHQLTVRVYDTTRISSIHEVFQAIADGNDGLPLILDLISKKLTDLYIKRLVTDSDASYNSMLRIIDDLIKFSKVNGFNEHFFEYCGNNLLEIVLSPEWRHNEELMLTVARLFMSVNTTFPVRLTQFIGFMLLLKSEDAILPAFKLCSKFDPIQLENIKQLILDVFDDELNKDKSKVSSELTLYLRQYPSIALERRKEMFSLLNKKLQVFSQSGQTDADLLLLICTLFNALAPKRGHSILSSQATEKSSSIPLYIVETSPHFWKLYEKYQGMINGILENHPIFLKQFSFLLDYPELVSFKIRSSYFRKQKLNNITLFRNYTLHVERNNILESSFNGFQILTAKELLHDFHVKFDGEQDADEAELKREWFILLTKEILNQKNSLFSCSKRKKNYQPNPKSSTKQNYVEYFYFIGQFIALALIEGSPINAHFTTSFCRQILHREPKFKDLEDVDQELYQSLQKILDNDVNSMNLTFEFENDESGSHEIVELKENGGQIKVTNENKKEFVHLRANYVLQDSIDKQISSFCKGFDSLISHEEIQIFTPNEINLLICGIPKIDVNDMKANTVIDPPLNNDTPVVKFFFDAISKWNDENLSKLLFFMTGSTRVPVNGFKEFCEMTGSPLKIQAGGDRSKYPQSHTCINSICLPQYESEEELNEKLLKAIQECDSFEIY